MRIVKISDLTEEQKKQWEEDVLKRKEENENILNILEQEKNNKNNKSKDSWFNPVEYFEDGFQIEDIGNMIGTGLSTIGDIGTNLIKGVANIGEGIGDAMSYGIADINEWFGNEDKANQIRKNAQQNLVEGFFAPAEDFFDENSLLGEKSDNVVESLGYVAGMTAIAVASSGTATALGASAGTAGTVASVASSAATFTSAMGNGITEALNDGATIDEARLYGAIAGAGETVSELMFGGLGKASGALGLSKGVGELDDIVIGGLTKNIKNKMVKRITQYGLKATGEGIEEIVSGLISAAGKKATYMKERDFKDIVNDEKLAEQFWMGCLTSAIAQGPTLVRSTRTKSDYITGRTYNEQRVYDSEVKSRTEEKIKKTTIEKAYNEQIETKKNLGIEITEQVKAETMQKVENAYNNGTLETIELSKKDLGAIEKQVQNDLEEGNISSENIMKTLGENQDLSKDNLLMRSMYESQQKYESYKVEKTDNEKVNLLMQSANEAGLNNTSKTRKKVELISKLVENTDRQYRFVSEEQLTEMGYNKNANGLTDKSTGEILISVNSNKEIVAVVGHETTHLFDGKVKGEYTQEYKDLQDAVTSFLKANGTYETKINQILETYGNAGINLTQEQIMEEVTADTIGDNLFGDNAEQFIKKLSSNKNVFQKIYDYIKKAVQNIKGYNSEEAKQLQNLKDKFEKVYKTLDITTDTDTTTKYSIAGKQGMNNAIKADTSNLIIEQSYNKALQLAKNGTDNESIRKSTNWFQDKNGDWKFEFSDKDMSLKNDIKLEKEKTYKLKDLLEHNILFEIYPELLNYNVEFKNIKAQGSFYKNDNTIRINSNKLLQKNLKTSIESTLIHEIQHAIQNIEGFEGGKSSKLSKLRYYNSLGEIEAKDTQNRFLKEENGKLNRFNEAPESSKISPQHADKNRYLNNRNIIDKVKDSIYNYFKSKGDNYEISENIISKDSKRNSYLVDGRRRLENQDVDTRYSMTEGETDQYWKKKTLEDEVGNKKGLENSNESSFNLSENIDGEVGIYDKTVEEVLNQTPEEKEQGMKDKAKKYLSRSKTKFINKIVDDFGTSKIANTKLLNNIVDSIREDITNNESLTKEQADTYFNDLYNNLVKLDTAYYDEYKEVKNNIRKTKVYVSDDIRNNITDYKEFRQSNIGTLIMTNDSSNIAVDEYYKELNELYPELFPSDIVNATDQLQRISEVAKDISKVETNVAAYNDKYMGKEYRNWARAEFDKDINDFTQDIKLADRYNLATNKKIKLGADKELVKNAYSQLPDAKKVYEKALAKELLTAEDKVQVDRLLKNEIQIADIPKGLNTKGIINVAMAKQEYDTLNKVIKEYQDNIKQSRISEAENDVGDLNLWKDKKIGFLYSRETPIRNIYDIAPKEVADNIVNKYFRPYIEDSEKKVIDAINGYNDRIKKLEIGTKNKYEITLNNNTQKVSESALVQLLGEKKITANDVEKAGANVAKIESAVQEFRSIYNELIEQINESLLDNGYGPVEYRKDYFPHFTEEKADTLLEKAAKMFEMDITTREELPTDIAGQTYQFKPGKTWFGNILQRTTDITDYDVLKGFDKYVRGATGIIYHTGDIQRLRALSTAIRGTYNDTEIQNKIQEIKESTMSDLDKSIEIQEVYNKAKDKTHLSKFVEWLDNYINLLANKKSINDRGAEKELNRQVYTTMQDIESRIAANAIGGNVGVSLTNFAPLAQAWGEVKTHNLINGVWQTMKASLGKDTSFAENSQFITRRRGADTLVETTINKITKPLNTVLEFADKFTSEAIVRARYNQNLQEGMSSQMALEEADRYVAGLMADRGKGALPTQFNNKNPIAKMINMFQVEVNNQWSYYIKDLPKNVQDKANNNKAKIVKNTAIAYSKIMIGSYLINELLGSIRGNSTRVLPDPIYIIKELLKGLSDDDDDNDDDTIIKAITEIAGNVPFISLPATLFADTLGLEVGDIGRISVSGAIPNAKNIISDTIDVINKQKTLGEGAESIGKELLDTIGVSLVLPYGGSQIKKTVKGLGMYLNEVPGSYTDKGDLRYTVDDDVGSKIQAALFGAYANQYAQDYIDSGYKSIKKQNIDEMVGLDMNSTEYRNYKAKLSKVSNTSDKNGYKQYVDSKGNVYWYDSDNEIMYNDSYKKTTLTADDLTKVSKKEEALNYIDSLDISDEKKNIMANNLDKSSKKKIDMSTYGNYNSYEEYKYARDYPEKYNTIMLIDSYDNYNTYKDKISQISKKYKELGEDLTDKQKTQLAKQKKSEIRAYIEDLPLNMYQKIILEKEAGGYSIKDYKNHIYNYLEEQNLTQQEKYNIWKELFD